MDRRVFLGYSALTALQLATLGLRPAHATTGGTDLRPAGDLLDLPRGFRYRVLQRAGQPTDDGFVVPLQPDGMACFATDADTWTLLRNHELGREGYMERLGLRTAWTQIGEPPPQPSYRPEQWEACRASSSTPERSNASSPKAHPTHHPRRSDTAIWRWQGLRETARVGFCRGWVTCEETDEAGHGWAFSWRPAMTRCRHHAESTVGAGCSVKGLHWIRRRASST